MSKKRVASAAVVLAAGCAMTGCMPPQQGGTEQPQQPGSPTGKNPDSDTSESSEPTGETRERGHPTFETETRERGHPTFESGHAKGDSGDHSGGGTTTCNGSNLRGSFSAYYNPNGTRQTLNGAFTGSLIVTNTGSTPCETQGGPTMGIQSSAGTTNWLPTDHTLQPSNPTPIRLNPGQRVISYISWYEQNPQSPGGGRLMVQPPMPGGRPSTTLPVAVDVPTNAMRVSVSAFNTSAFYQG